MTLRLSSSDPKLKKVSVLPTVYYTMFLTNIRPDRIYVFPKVQYLVSFKDQKI